MTDRELLEMAAKAIGLTLQYNYLGGRDANQPWDPLTDDGDALRLAAKLRLIIKPGKYWGDGCTVDTQRNGIPGVTAFYDDKENQMRRAIVSAAANIGKAMP